TVCFFFSSRRRHTRFDCDWSSDVCSSDLDVERGGGRWRLKMSDGSAFRFGENLAISPGKVVYQNELMQLVQYAPSTTNVRRRPQIGRASCREGGGGGVGGGECRWGGW